MGACDRAVAGPPLLEQGCLGGREQPRLAAGELVLRPWSAADGPAVAAAYDDPDIQRRHVRSMTGDEAQAWAASWAKRWRADEAASWAVVDGQDVLLGRVGIQGLDLELGLGHVAYWVVPAARRRGVAHRALAAVTDWAFGDLGLHRLQLEHATRNAASCGVARSAGYEPEGTLRSAWLQSDGWHDVHVHARVAPLT